MMKVHEHDREYNENDKHSICQKMVNTYLSEVSAPRHSNPLHYWKEKKVTWPLLAYLARKYLAPPCTAVPSEILFSIAGNIVTDRRTWLDVEKVEMLLFLNKIIHLKDY